jgi:hypothetical protein
MSLLSLSDAVRPTPPSPAIRPGAGPATHEGNTARGGGERKRRRPGPEPEDGERAPEAPPAPAETPPQGEAPARVDIRV